MAFDFGLVTPASAAPQSLAHFLSTGHSGAGGEAGGSGGGSGGGPPRSAPPLSPAHSLTLSPGSPAGPDPETAFFYSAQRASSVFACGICGAELAPGVIAAHSATCLASHKKAGRRSVSKLEGGGAGGGGILSEFAGIRRPSVTGSSGSGVAPTTPSRAAAGAASASGEGLFSRMTASLRRASGASTSAAPPPPQQQQQQQLATAAPAQPNFDESSEEIFDFSEGGASPAPLPLGSFLQGGAEAAAEGGAAAPAAPAPPAPEHGAPATALAGITSKAVLHRQMEGMRAAMKERREAGAQ